MNAGGRRSRRSGRRELARRGHRRFLGRAGGGASLTCSACESAAVKANIPLLSRSESAAAPGLPLASFVSNPVIAGRALARQALIAQSAVALLVALAFLPAGLGMAVGAGVGGFAVVLGSAAALRLALGNAVDPASSVLLRLLLAMALKWVIVATVLGVGLAVWRVPPLGLFAGLLVGLIAQAWIMARR